MHAFDNTKSMGIILIHMLLFLEIKIESVHKTNPVLILAPQPIYDNSIIVTHNKIKNTFSKYMYL